MTQSLRYDIIKYENNTDLLNLYGLFKELIFLYLMAENRPKLTNQQKSLLAFLSIFSVAILILGVLQIRSNFKQPFNIEIAETSRAYEDQLKLQELKTKDTDSDGLDDYSELYIYNTSPYLADSDSDDTSDAEEIINESDPNCPEGKECTQTRSVNINTDETDGGAFNPQAVSEDEIALLRESLENAGVPASMLEEITDGQLFDLYSETVNEEGGTGDIAADLDASNVNTDPYADLLERDEEGYGSIYGIEDLSTLTAEQVRELMIASGVEEDALNQVDDEELMTIYKEALAEEGVTTE